MFDFLSTFFLSSAALTTLGFGTPDGFSSVPPSRLVAEVENYGQSTYAETYDGTSYYVPTQCNNEGCGPSGTYISVNAQATVAPNVYGIEAFNPSYSPPVNAQFLFIPLGYVAQTATGQNVFVPYVVDSNGGNSAGMGGGVTGGTVTGGQPSNAGDPLDGLQGSYYGGDYYSGTINDRVDPADVPSPYNANDPMATGGYQPTPGAVGGFIPGPAVGPAIGLPTDHFTSTPVGTPVGTPAPATPVTGPVTGTPAPGTQTTNSPVNTIGSVAWGQAFATTIATGWNSISSYVSGYTAPTVGGLVNGLGQMIGIGGVNALGEPNPSAGTVGEGSGVGGAGDPGGPSTGGMGGPSDPSGGTQGGATSGGNY